MSKINLDIYNLFLEHGSECLWNDDTRVRRPKGTTEETDKMFHILEMVNHKLEMIASKVYSPKIINAFKKEIGEHKLKIDEEVFELMKKKYQ